MYNHFNEFITDDNSSNASEDEDARNFDQSEIGGQTQSNAANENLSGENCGLNSN